MSPKIEKEYFKSDDIVNWWNPEGDSASFSEYLPSTTKLKNLHQNILDDFVKNIDFTNKKYLDAGTGKGRFAKASTSKQITGLDFNKGMILITKDRIPNIKLIQGDIENIPVSSCSFDIVSCMETLIHIPNIDKAIFEFSRILKLDGTLIVNVQNKHSYLGYVEYYGIFNLLKGTFTYIKKRLFTKQKNHTHLISKNDFEKILEKYGFRIEKKIQYGKCFTVLTTYICRKV